MKFEHLMAAGIHDIKNQLHTLSDYESEALPNIPEKYHQHIQPIFQRTVRLKNDTLQIMILFRFVEQKNFPLEVGWSKDSVSHAIHETRLEFPSVTFNNDIDDACSGFYDEPLVQIA